MTSTYTDSLLACQVARWEGAGIKKQQSQGGSIVVKWCEMTVIILATNIFKMMCRCTFLEEVIVLLGLTAGTVSEKWKKKKDDT